MLELRPLGRAAHHQLLEQWTSVEAMFLDDPDGAVAQADALVDDVLRVRGATVGDLELLGAELSVAHPSLVGYRDAHAIALASRDDEVGMAALDRAFAKYRAMFADLLAPPTEQLAEREAGQLRRAW